MEPREIILNIEKSASLPLGKGDRFAGYTVIGLPFRSGHVLALRRFPASSEQKLAEAVHVAAALRAGGAIPHGPHLFGCEAEGSSQLTPAYYYSQRRLLESLAHSSAFG